MIKALPWIFFGAALSAAFYLFVLLLDAGITLDNARSYSTRLRERSDLALSIIRRDWTGKDVALVVALSKEFEEQGVISKRTKEGSFEIGDFIFEIDGDVVTGVRYFD